jgi:demethylmenaquinone methyltransferase / 2-methoxy-6-polyprenyl-1,4-benzoquinol methylase
MNEPTESMAPSTRTADEERDYYALNRRVYRRLAPFYDLVALPLRRIRREVARMVDAHPGSKILDVATGTGEQAMALAERGAEVTGIDIAEPMLRVARRKNRRPNLTFRQADATSLPFADATFDVCSISFALHEMPPSIRDRVLREMARVAKPGGTVVVVDYGLPRRRVSAWMVYHLVKLYERDHYAELVRGDLQRMLRRAGLAPTTDLPALGGIARIVLARR